MTSSFIHKSDASLRCRQGDRNDRREDGDSGFLWFFGLSLRKSEISITELARYSHYSAARGHNIWTFCVDVNAAKRDLSSSVIIQPGSPGASLPRSLAL